MLRITVLRQAAELSIRYMFLSVAETNCPVGFVLSM